MTIGERIAAKRAEAGFTLDKLAKKVEVSLQTIQRYESGAISNIPANRIESLAAALHTTPAYLMGWEDGEKPHAAALRQSLVQNPAAAEGVLPLPEIIHADCTLFCRDDAMEPAIYEGDATYVKKQMPIENGDIAAVAVGEETLLRKVYVHTDSLILRPLNPAYQPTAFFDDTMDTVKIIGKVVAVVHLL